MTAQVSRRDKPQSVQLGFPAGWLVGSLPAVMQEDPFLTRFVTMFEEIASTVRYAVEKTSDVADVTVTPAPMVRYLGQWVQAPGIHQELPVTKQREIVRAAGETMPERGTARALERLLGAVTGGAVTVHDSGGVFADGKAPIGPATVVVRIETTGHLNDTDVRNLVRAEVPAHIPVEVFFTGPVQSAAVKRVEVPT